MPNTDDWERIRRDRIALLTRTARELLVKAKSIGINLRPGDVDQTVLSAKISAIVEQYLDMLKDYKTRNHYAHDERVQPTKIAAFLALLVARDCPIRTRNVTGGTSLNSVEAALANAYLAWRIIQSLLKIKRIDDEHVEYIIRSLHNVDTNCGSSPAFIEDWGIIMMEAMCDAWGTRLSLQHDLA